MPDTNPGLMTLFNEALERTTPAEQAAYLERACGGDVELRRRVEDLLAAHSGIGQFLETEALATPNTTIAYVPSDLDESKQATVTYLPQSVADLPTITHISHSPSTPQSGRAESLGLGDIIAGRYTLNQVIGEGGMGSVYLANQTEPVKRQVALKLIKSGLVSKGVLARFDAERQALALMDHPNIARIYDGGVTPSGQPYFVMELVQGVPITDYCDNHRLTVEARLHLFVSVCQAVQHAHQKGIIHRDLKPSNVLVTEVDGRPTPKVIDFGVAKATEQKLTDMSFNDIGAIVGTPAYMSPEQADPSSMDIDTRTDVYALGVMLYELLTGSPPFDSKQFKRGAILEMLRMVREVEPPWPSTKLSTSDALPNIAANRNIEPARLAKLLQGELDWVVMKALEKDRTRRYETANGLARDLQCFFADEVVEARPPSRGYRFQKFVKRNKAQVIAASLVGAALVAGILGTSWQAYRAEQARANEADQRKLAEDATEKEIIERRRAEYVARLMESVFEGIDPNAENELGQTLKEQLIGKLDRLAVELDASTGEPLADARMMVAIGRTYQGLSEYLKAEKLAKKSLVLRRKHLGDDHLSTIESELEVAVCAQQQGYFDVAQEILERVRRKLPADTAVNGIDEAFLDQLLATVYQGAGRHREAVVMLEALRNRIRVRGGPDTKDDLLILHKLGTTYRELGRHLDAIALLEDVLARRTQLLGPDSPDVLWTANSLAVSYSASGRYADAVKLQTETHDRLLKRFGPDHLLVLNSGNNLAASRGRTGQVKDEIALLEDLQSRAIAKQGVNNPATLRIIANLGRAYRKDRRYDNALKCFDQVLPPMSAIYGPENPLVVSVYVSKANCFDEMGRYKDAIAVMESVVSRKAKKDGPDHPETLNLRAQLARHYQKTDNARSIEMIQDVLDKQTQKLGPEHADTLTTMITLGTIYFSANRAKEAIAIFEKALPRCVSTLGPEHTDTLKTQSHLGAAYWLNEQLDRSIPLLEETLQKQAKVQGVEHRETLQTAENLLINYETARQSDRVFEHLVVWLPLLMKARGPDNPKIGSFVLSFVRECSVKGRMVDAIPVLEIAYENALSKLGPDHAGTIQFQNNLATAYWSAGRLDRSIPLLEDVVARAKKIQGESHPNTLQAIGSLSRNYIDAGRYQEVIPILTEAVANGKAKFGALPPALSFLQRNLGVCLAKDGQKQKGRELILDSLATSRDSYSKGSIQLAGILSSVSLSLLEIDAFAEAEPLLRECLAIREKSQPDLWSTFNTHSMLGGALLGQKKYGEAEPLLLKGYEGMKAREKSVPPSGLARIPEALDRLIELYSQTKKPVEMQKYKELRAKYASVRETAPKPRETK